MKEDMVDSLDVSMEISKIFYESKKQMIPFQYSKDICGRKSFKNNTMFFIKEEIKLASFTWIKVYFTLYDNL